MAKLSSTPTTTYKVLGQPNNPRMHAYRDVARSTYTRKGDATRAYNKAQASGRWRYLKIVEVTPTIYASMPKRTVVAEYTMPMFEVVHDTAATA